VSWNLRFQERHECRVHVVILVWYIETYDTFVAKMRTKLLGQFASMHLFHDEYQLGPRDQLRRDGILSLIGQTCRCNLKALPRSKNLLCRRTAKAVLTANEQDPRHRSATMHKATKGTRLNRRIPILYIAIPA